MFNDQMYSQQQPGMMPRQDPYGYDMGSTLPNPAMGMNSSSIPSLHPSSLTPNLSEGTFMPGDRGGMPQYRRGGRIRRYARGGSHNIFESMYNNMPSARDVGYGLLPTATGALGGMMGGPMGAAAGTALGGGIAGYFNGNGSNPYANAAIGAGSALLPMGGGYTGSMIGPMSRHAGAALGGGLSGYLQSRDHPMRDTIGGAALSGFGSKASGMAMGGDVPHYAKGGLAELAEKVRQQGTDGDMILAHINPMEAAQLAEQSGGASINPHTGLPSYKFKIGKILKGAAKIAAPFIGGAIAGPAGAAIGGGLSGALSGKKPKLKNVLIGAGLGYVGGGGFGNLGGIGSIIPSVNKAVGLNSVFGAGKGAAAVKAGASVGAKEAAKAGAGAAGKGGIGGMLGGLGGLLGSDPLNNALLGTAVLGTLAGKRKVPNEGNAVENAKKAGMAGAPDRPVKPTERVQRILSDEERFKEGMPEQLFFEDVNPAVQYMAHGGYLDGHTGGEADKIDAKLSDGEFVIRADVVSGLGDGNNKAGAKKLDMLQKNVLKHKGGNRSNKPPLKAKSLEAYMKTRSRRRA